MDCKGLKRKPRPRGRGFLSHPSGNRLDSVEANDTERLFAEATSGSVCVELIQARCTRHGADETDCRRNNLLCHRGASELVQLEVEHIVASEGIVELRNNNELRLRPSVGNVLAHRDSVLVDLVEELVASEGDADLEGMLGRNEVARALLLEFRHGRVEVGDDLVEVLLRPLGVPVLVLRNRNVRIEVGVVENTVGLVVTEVVAVEGNRVGVELERKAESRAVRLVSGRLLADGRKTSLFESTREDTLSEADDGAVFLVVVVTGERSLGVVAVRTDGARELADTEDDALLVPLTVGGAAEELISSRSLGHDRDNLVHPVLEELHGDLSGRVRDALCWHSVHDILHSARLLVERHTHKCEVLHRAEVLRGLVKGETLDLDLRHAEFAFSESHSNLLLS